MSDLTENAPRIWDLALTVEDELRSARVRFTQVSPRPSGISIGARADDLEALDLAIGQLLTVGSRVERPRRAPEVGIVIEREIAPDQRLFDLTSGLAAPGVLPAVFTVRLVPVSPTR